MKKLAVILVLITGFGTYLHFVRGWDWARFRQAGVDQVPFIEAPADPRPIGSRGIGTRWEFAARMPEPRSYMGAAAIAGKIYVVGGLGAYGGTLSRLDVYDIATDTWAVGPRMPQAIHHPAVTTDGEKLYVIGGLTGLNNRPIDGAYEYDPKNREWHSLPNLSDFRGAAAAFVDGETMVVGGMTQGGPIGTVERLTGAKTVWSIVPGLAVPRRRLAAVTADDGVYVLGGDQGEDALAVVEIGRQGVWSAAEPMPRPRTGHAAAMLNGRIYVVGGETPENTLEEIDVYDTLAKTWSTMHLVMPSSRHGLAAVTYENRLYAIGGGERPGFSVSDKMEVLILER